MFTWIRVTALMAFALVLATWTVVLGTGVDTESLIAIGATTVLALAVVAALPADRPVALVAVGEWAAGVGAAAAWGFSAAEQS